VLDNPGFESFFLGFDCVTLKEGLAQKHRQLDLSRCFLKNSEVKAQHYKLKYEQLQREYQALSEENLHLVNSQDRVRKEKEYINNTRVELDLFDAYKKKIVKQSNLLVQNEATIEKLRKDKAHLYNTRVESVVFEAVNKKREQQSNLLLQQERTIEELNKTLHTYEYNHIIHINNLQKQKQITAEIWAESSKKDRIINELEVSNMTNSQTDSLTTNHIYQLENNISEHRLSATISLN